MDTSPVISRTKLPKPVIHYIKIQSGSDSDEEWFIGAIKHNENEWLKVHYHFITDLYITTQHHHRRQTKLISKCNTGADTSVISKKTYMSLTIDYGLKQLSPPDGWLKVFGGGTVKNLGVATI